MGATDGRGNPPLLAVPEENLELFCSKHLPPSYSSPQWESFVCNIKGSFVTLVVLECMMCVKHSYHIGRTSKNIVIIDETCGERGGWSGEMFNSSVGQWLKEDESALSRPLSSLWFDL